MNLNRGWPYYVVGWLLPLVVTAVIVILAMALGIVWAWIVLTGRLQPETPAQQTG
ncbi:MAG: hypothetical protein KKA73_23630 [Chloroflexi bacterium]|nr:hypothetical protein [Chloroflexota bacterium]MBU1750684.1 hypothetical protein [Chloroflexota bacterium]MBU1878439.1 hypothetical protein [Chloroflexota bacterium]